VSPFISSNLTVSSQILNLLIITSLLRPSQNTNMGYSAFSWHGTRN
jgi:hypothetical protein